MVSWALLVGVVLVLGVAVATIAARRAELGGIARGRAERSEAQAKGTARARLQYPHIDLSRCIGCGTCVAACPEDGVLGLLHGQALVVHGARCVGHGRCAQECPVGAIAVTLGDLGQRDDIPALGDSLEAVGSPGLFLAGEVTGYALIRTAIGHGTAVAAEVARRRGGNGANGAPGPVLDLCVVGAGPAGIACSLEAKRRGLSFVTLDQEEEIGGTVAKYPRRKLVLTQPVELPLHGKLSQTSYSKEDLMAVWREVVERNELPLRGGRRFTALERAPEGHYLVRAEGETFSARNVCLALGRRGSPRKLGVPGEDLPKVAYSLLDAQSYHGRRIVVVGGGDSAIEAAVGLAEQPGNEVLLSYRKPAFFRIKARNEARLLEAQHEGRLRVLLASDVRSIQPDSVDLEGPWEDGRGTRRIPNDEVFVMAGGIPPFELLKSAGVSFDPADRPAAAPLVEQGSGLLRALAAALVLALAAAAWAAVHAEYYGLPAAERPLHPLHDVLRPSRGVGLGLGIAAALLLAANLAYLARRSPRVRLTFGSLRKWMTVHVVTGVLALLCALLHGAMDPRDTVGGHALAGLAVLVVTGAIGRYFYAIVPRAANGRELAIDEVRGHVDRLSQEWDRGPRELGDRVRREIQALTEGGRWSGSFLRRLVALSRSQRRLRRVLLRIERDGRRAGIADAQLRETLRLARRAHRASLMAAHYEDVRGLLASWRYVHRWTALLVVSLVVLHVVAAVRYGFGGAA